KYLSDAASEPNDMHEDLNKYPHAIENGFISDPTSFGYPANHKSIVIPEQSQSMDCRLPSNKSLSILNELCNQEGFELSFQPCPSHSADIYNDGEVHLQAEVDGQVLGVGTGTTWEEARHQASEEALANLKPSLQFSQKHVPFSRSFQTAPNKRLKSDFSRSFPRTNSSRYSKNETFVP
ncbi:RNA polymerase II C-terminal domain phosphatase-like protein, partial [Zostera marina]